MQSLTETQKAYIAGIIDGEGCISISKKPRGLHYNYNFKVTICSVDSILAEWFMKNTEAKLYLRKPIAGRLGKRVQHVILFQNDSALGILKEVLEYMLIKRERAEFILNNYPKKFSKATEQRDFIYERLRGYNQRTIANAN